MKENLTLQRPEILNQEAIDRHLSQLNIKTSLTNEDYKQLSLGMQTGFLSNIHINNKVFSGRIQSRYDERMGKYVYHINAQRFKLNIPEKELAVILKRKLTEKEMSELHEGKKIGPFKNKSSEFFVAVDKELNKVTLYSSKYLGIPNQFGEYKFSPQEKQNLAQGLSVGPKVFKLDNNTYVLANYNVNPSLTQYSQSLEIFREMNKQQAAEFIKKYNTNHSQQVNQPLENLTTPVLLPFDQQKKVVLDSGSPEVLNPSRYNLTQYRNSTFDFYHITSKKTDEKFSKVLNTIFTQDELSNMQNGKGVYKTITIPKTGKTITSTFYLSDNNNGTHTLYIQQPELTPNKNLVDTNQLVVVPKPQLFTEQDKLVLNLIDKKNFKDLNNLVENGYKPSEDVQRLIINSEKLTINDKLTAAHVLKFDEHKLMALHQQELPKSLKEAGITHGHEKTVANEQEKVKPPSMNLSDDKGHQKKGNKDHDKQPSDNPHKKHETLNFVKNMFSDM